MLKEYLNVAAHRLGEIQATAALQATASANQCETLASLESKFFITFD